MNDLAKKTELELLSSAALVALYNNNVPAEKAVKKFSDRATAVKRTLAVLPDSFWAIVEPEKAAPKAKPEWPFDEKAKAAADHANAISVAEAKKSSEAIAKSWLNPVVAAARAKRNNVLVEGRGFFVSVKQAFLALDLPIGQHIKFRLELKAKKAATIGQYHFKLY